MAGPVAPARYDLDGAAAHGSTAMWLPRGCRLLLWAMGLPRSGRAPTPLRRVAHDLRSLSAGQSANQRVLPRVRLAARWSAIPASCGGSGRRPLPALQRRESEAAPVLPHVRNGHARSAACRGQGGRCHRCSCSCELRTSGRLLDAAAAARAGRSGRTGACTASPRGGAHLRALRRGGRCGVAIL